jgi:hypothetical protein
VPRPDITLHATAESRRKGALVAAERKRELGKTVRERLAEIAQDEAERIAAVYLEAMEAADGDGNPDHRARVRAADALLAQAFGRPPLSIEVEKQSEEIIIISPMMSRMQEAKEAQEAQERELKAARPALPPGGEYDSSVGTPPRFVARQATRGSARNRPISSALIAFEAVAVQRTRPSATGKHDTQMTFMPGPTPVGPSGSLVRGPSTGGCCEPCQGGDQIGLAALAQPCELAISLAEKADGVSANRILGGLDEPPRVSLEGRGRGGMNDRVVKSAEGVGGPVVGHLRIERNRLRDRLGGVRPPACAGAGGKGQGAHADREIEAKTHSIDALSQSQCGQARSRQRVPVPSAQLARNPRPRG